MTLTWKLGALVGLVLVAAGWVAHGIANGPPPDVAALLAEARAKASAETAAQYNAARKVDAVRIATLEATADSARRASTQAQASGRKWRATADTAGLRTDAALELLAQRGAETTELAAALATERAARDSGRVADSVAFARKSEEADAQQRRAAILLAGRATDSARIGELTDLSQRLAAGLKRASKRGLDPAVTLSYGVSCTNVTVGGSVRVLGWLRAGVHVDTKDCSR